jgi:hypothetical protein
LPVVLSECGFFFIGRKLRRVSKAGAVPYRFYLVPPSVLQKALSFHFPSEIEQIYKKKAQTAPKRIAITPCWVALVATASPVD